MCRTSSSDAKLIHLEDSSVECVATKTRVLDDLKRGAEDFKSDNEVLISLLIGMDNVLKKFMSISAHF